MKDIAVAIAISAIPAIRRFLGVGGLLGLVLESTNRGKVVSKC